MASSTRQAIACILVIFAIVIVARAQSGSEKRQGGATFNGKVTIKGKGAPGIAVGLIRTEESMSQQATNHRTFTDDEGNYRITNVGPGKYKITVAAPGLIPADPAYSEKLFLISKSETLENVDFALVRGGVITGRVTNSDGRPLIEEEVLFRQVQDEQPRQNYTYYYSSIQPARTDDRGVYRKFGLPPGKYRVSTAQSGADSYGSHRTQTFHPATTEASQATLIEVTEGGEASNVDITLSESDGRYSAHGRIIDGDTGQPLANISYGIRKRVTETRTSGYSTGAVTNKDGEFKLDDLSPGKYAVFANATSDSDWRSEDAWFEVTDQDVTGLTVKTFKTASASGVLVLEGTNDKAIHEKLRKAFLSVEISRPGSNSSSSQGGPIPEDGSFKFSGLGSGILSFSISNQRFRIVRVERAGVAQPQAIELKEREHITGLRLIVNYPNGVIQGIVTVDGNSTPANGRFMVSMKRLGDLDTPFSNYAAQVDARGQFLAEGLVSGTYEITIYYAPDQSERTFRHATTQQVVVTNGAVANVTFNVDTSTNPRRP